MKKTILSVAAIAMTMAASAEGYQVNTLSAKQNGMGHTGTALKLNAESMIFNPAGMGFMDKTIDFSGSVTGIFATAKATTPDGKVYETDNPASTPMSANLGFSIYDNLKAGVSFYTPYGSNIDWTDNWAGAMLNQSVKLATYTIQPTISWRITPKLSVGAGLMMTWGTVNLNKGLVSPSSLDALMQSMGMPAAFGTTVPASVNLKGTTSIALGANLGVMYDIDNRWTVGVSYRSKMSMKVKAGTASLSYVNDIAKTLLESKLGVIDKANFKAEMPCVSILNFGGSFKPMPNLTLAADVQVSFWKEYKQLDIEFLSEQLRPFDQNLVKNYRNSLTYHIGAEWGVTNRFDLRAGLMIDTAPMRTDNYNPETPGMTKIEPSVGLSFRPVKNFSIDFSMLYVAGLGRDNASCTYKNLLTGADDTFVADYKVTSFNPSIGVTYNF